MIQNTLHPGYSFLFFFLLNFSFHFTLTHELLCDCEGSCTEALRGKGPQAVYQARLRKDNNTEDQMPGGGRRWI